MIVDKLKKRSRTIASEIEGWDKFAKDEGWLNPPDDYILYLPKPKVKVPGDTLHWNLHAENFNRSIAGIKWKGKKVLDIAAGRTWSSKELALRGAKVTATDILVNDGVGLKTAYRYFKKYKIHYGLVRCDMNDLPFKDESFDVVIVHASIHHSENLQKAIGEMRRVCKKGGLIIFSNEAVGTFYTDFLNKHFVKILDYGIHETAPRLKEYFKQFKNDEITIIPAKQIGWRDFINPLSLCGGTLNMRVRKR